MTAWPVKGDAHPFVRLAQRRLATLGFPLDETGLFDDATEDTLRRFQTFYQIPESGTFDGPTMIHLWRLTRDTTT